METTIDLAITRQPDDITCGPACLHSVYRYYGYELSMDEVVSQVQMLEEGGTLAPNLGVHALKLGFSATLRSLNVGMFDPSWPIEDSEALYEKLTLQARAKPDRVKLQRVTQAYQEYLRLGGRVQFGDLTAKLIRKILKASTPIICGLSATYLYRCPREDPYTNQSDDVGGYPAGHFVVLRGIDLNRSRVLVSDPYRWNPYSESHDYEVDIEHLICAILLGVITYDANLLVIAPPDNGERLTIE